jgi:hypothetical protein
MGERGLAVVGARRSRTVVGVLVVVVMSAFGCTSSSGSGVGPDASSMPAVDRPVPYVATAEAECEAVATVLLLGGERIFADAAEASTAERAAIEEAYAEARRAVPPDLLDAVAEVELVYDRIEAEYLALLADLRGGAPHDRLEVLRVFESRRPELREIVERTGLDEPCERLTPGG